MERLCIFDLETTGISAAQGHRAIEIGVVEVINRKITDRNFHVYLNPDRAIDKRAQEVHGISSAFLADKPRFKDIAKDLLDFIKGSVMIAHNASFDESFLTMELGRINLLPLENYCEEIKDSLLIARKLYPGKKNSLDALCKRLDVSNSHRELHGALLDSELLAQVYLKLTGGQETLSFEQQDNSKVLDKSKVKSFAVKAGTISKEELKQHEQWIDNLVGDGTSCLFKELQK